MKRFLASLVALLLPFIATAQLTITGPNNGLLITPQTLTNAQATQAATNLFGTANGVATDLSLDVTAANRSLLWKQSGTTIGQILLNAGHSGGPEMELVASRLYAGYTQAFQLGQSGAGRHEGYVYLHSGSATVSDTLRFSDALVFDTYTWTAGASLENQFAVQSQALDESGTNAALRFYSNATIVSGSGPTAGDATGTLAFEVRNAGPYLPDGKFLIAGGNTAGINSVNTAGVARPDIALINNAGLTDIALGRQSVTGGDHTNLIFQDREGATIFAFLRRSGDYYFNVPIEFREDLKTPIGKTLLVKSGANSKAGTFTLSSGTATVSNSSVTANSVVSCSLKTSGGTPGIYSPQIVLNAGVGFTAYGLANDDSTYNFVILEVN